MGGWCFGARPDWHRPNPTKSLNSYYMGVPFFSACGHHTYAVSSSTRRRPLLVRAPPRTTFYSFAAEDPAPPAVARSTGSSGRSSSCPPQAEQRLPLRHRRKVRRHARAQDGGADVCKFQGHRNPGMIKVHVYNIRSGFRCALGSPRVCLSWGQAVASILSRYGAEDRGSETRYRDRDRDSEIEL